MDTSDGIVIALVCLLALQVLWTLANPPLLHKPRTWFIHWSMKASAGLTPAMAALSLL